MVVNVNVPSCSQVGGGTAEVLSTGGDAHLGGSVHCPAVKLPLVSTTHRAASLRLEWQSDDCCVGTG